MSVVDLADCNIKMLFFSNYSSESSQSDLEPRILPQVDGYRKMFDQSLSKSKELGDMMRLLPGVVVQKEMSRQGMIHLYGIKADLLECLIKSTILQVPRYASESRYILDEYLSGFLQNRDRSQLYYCDPMLQHISICRHILSLLDGTNGLHLLS